MYFIFLSSQVYLPEKPSLNLGSGFHSRSEHRRNYLPNTSFLSPPCLLPTQSSNVMCLGTQPAHSKSVHTPHSHPKVPHSTKGPRVCTQMAISPLRNRPGKNLVQVCDHLHLQEFWGLSTQVCPQEGYMLWMGITPSPWLTHPTGEGISAQWGHSLAGVE